MKILFFAFLFVGIPNGMDAQQPPAKSPPIPKPIVNPDNIINILEALGLHDPTLEEMHSQVEPMPPSPGMDRLPTPEMLTRMGAALPPAKSPLLKIFKCREPLGANPGNVVGMGTPPSLKQPRSRRRMSANIGYAGSRRHFG